MRNVVLDHMSCFVDTFVPKTHKKRWKTLLNFKKPRYQDINPYDIWPDNDTEIKFCRILNSRFNQVLKSIPFNQYKDADVVVIPCGHDGKEPAIMSLNESLTGKYCLLEGVISIVKGKLVILVNHDGEACVFNNLVCK